MKNEENHSQGNIYTMKIYGLEYETFKRIFKLLQEIFLLPVVPSGISDMKTTAYIKDMSTTYWSSLTNTWKDAQHHYYQRNENQNHNEVPSHTGQNAAKSLQLCPTLCGPIDGSPPGSPIPGILQARTLEWVAISFSNAWKWKVKVKSLSHVWL